MFNRVNWGAIIAGAVIGIGITFMFSVIMRALMYTQATEELAVLGVASLTTPRAILAVVATGIAFTIGGAATVLLGRFQFRSQTALHSLAAFLVAAVMIHYFTRGALFIGYPGFPLIAGGPIQQSVSNLAGNFANMPRPTGWFGPTSELALWTIAGSCVAGAVTSVLGGLKAFRWLEANKVWGERERAETIHNAA